MIQTGFEKRVKVQQIVESQLPDFLRAESPKTIDFLKQYYASQEFQSGPSDLSENLDQYLKFDNLTPEVIQGQTTLYSDVSTSDDTIQVFSTKGFPSDYGLFKIGDEIITYTGLTTNTFTGCVRGFSGITSYRTDLDQEELVFQETTSASHTAGDEVQNLSALFLKEFYRKLKYTYAPGFEDVSFVSDLDVNNFLKEVRSFYESKGTEESYNIIFKVLFGETPKVVDLEEFLPKPSSAKYIRREQVVVERVSGDPNKLVGQTIQKSSDPNTQGSVSEVEIFTRSGINTFFKLGLFVGYDDRDLIEGTFVIQPETKVINPVAPGGTTITVDSTVGFGTTGTIIAGDTAITYSDKTINQFLGCQNVVNALPTKTSLRTNETFIGYEDGDITKKVEVRVTGVLKDIKPINDIVLATEGQKVNVKNVGEKIKNPVEKTYKQLFANSWVYNTSARFFIDTINGSNFDLKSEPDKSNLKVGDKVDVLVESSEVVAAADAEVASINGKQITLNNLGGFSPTVNVEYSVRRKLNTATSSGTPILQGDNILTTDIQNVYNENDEHMYVASNSLPSYDITKTTFNATLTSVTGAFQNFNTATLKYSILSFPSPVPFVTGDEVVYSTTGNNIVGLPEGSYFVKVLSLSNQIKLYRSRSLIATDTPEEFDIPSGTQTHTFTLVSQKSNAIAPQKLLRKFPIPVNIKNGEASPTAPGATGMFVNGVELLNYKSEDKIYFGPLSDARIYTGGTGYDVINLPNINIAGNAAVQPVVRGELKEIIVDPQSFDINRVISATLTGGNGSGAILEPIVDKRNRELEFDSRLTTFGGGVDFTNDDISFPVDHKLTSGEALLYNSKGNAGIGIGDYQGSNVIGTNKLNNGSTYYAEVINNRSIRLYETETDYASGINTVGFTTANNTGTHSFKLRESKNYLKEIKVINPGSGYENRKLFVQPTGVDTVSNSIKFENHGFSDGDVVVYSSDGTLVNGLNTTDRYSVIKLSDDEFRLANSGIGATDLGNFNRNNYVKFATSGVGTQFFAYPDVELTLNVDYGGSSNTITATPVIRGPIVDLYLYDAGSGYGSTVLNFHKKPDIDIEVGKEAEVQVIVSNGRINRTQIINPGSEYTSAPDLNITGDGIGGKLRAVVSGGKLTDVVIVNAGIGYSTANTLVKVVPNGQNAFIEASVRHLSVNNHNRFGNEILTEGVGGLQYAMVGYSTAIGSSEYGDNDSTVHSPIIGWAYDGNPIYGSYGYSDASDSNSDIQVVRSGYVLSPSDVVDRPSGFSNGFFVEDFKFDNSGELDQYNGRFAKTPEFPNGTYAYYAGINSSTYAPTFPFFIGHQYRSTPITQNVDQDFKFESSQLIRNTLPYGVGDLGIDNDFITEPNEIRLSDSTIKSVSKGSVESLIVNESGDGYKVGDVASFDNTGSLGGGVSAVVESLEGKTINELTTTVESYQNVQFVWDKQGQVSGNIIPTHTLLNNDTVIVSGVSTSIKGLSANHKIGVSSESVILFAELPSNATVGVVTDIYVNKIPSTVSVGSTIQINAERLSVLGTFRDRKVIRALRGETVGTAHTASTPLTVITGSFTLPLDVPKFESKLDDKVYFNPLQAVGFGTEAGIGTTRNYVVGNVGKSVNIPTQSLYIPNHPFTDGQQVTFRRLNATSGISVSNAGDSTPFLIPQVADSETMFVIKKSDDIIGLTTAVGLSTGGGLFWRSFGTNNSDEDFQYSLESNYDQVTARVQKIKSTVSVSTSHGLEENDVIQLTVKPSLSVGIGESTAVVVKYNSANDKLSINPIGFGNTAVTVNTDNFELMNHGFLSGDKVFYNSSSAIGGLPVGSYFVNRIDDNNFKLCLTKSDSLASPPIAINLTSQGSGHEISKINPQIPVVENNDLVFDVSDSSLSGYNFKLFYDEEFNNELVSIGTTTTFSVAGVGTVGLSGATVTLNYNESLPAKVYYSLEKSGYISTSDVDVSNNSEILFIESSYNNSYTVSGVGATTFDISIPEYPEKLSYNQGNTDKLSYTTKSASASGGVNSMQITYGGSGYKKLPKFVSIASTAGVNADIIPDSKSIGRIVEFNVDDPGFDFSADTTLSPEVLFSPNLTIVDRNIVSDVEIVDGGKKYTSAPDLIIADPETGVPYTTGQLKATIQGASVSSVEIIDTPIGLSDNKNKVYAINNSNGVGISSVIANSTGIVTCVLVTPVNNFTTAPFAVGDEIFVEGIQKNDSTGTGFNSADYKYQFFKVSQYNATNPARVIFDISSLTTNAGVAVTDSNTYASIIHKDDYPVFNVVQEPKNFIVGEKLLSKSGSTYSEIDLVVQEVQSDNLKVVGKYELSEGEQVFGRDSGTLATIKTIVENRARYVVDYSSTRELGWSDDIGKVNLDYQVLPDNDYYQNLSYTIKSSITYDDVADKVRGLVHPTGMKDFVDTGITSTTSVGPKSGTDAVDTATIDIINTNIDGSTMRVDTINFLDLGIDIDAQNNKSKFIKFANRKLTDYFKCVSNRVLMMDDIANQFSNTDSETNEFVDLNDFSILDGLTRFLVQVKNVNNDERQLTEIYTLPTPNADIITFEKGSVFNTSSKLGDVTGNIDENDVLSLRFTPVDALEQDFDIKVLKENFNTSLAGINTSSIGFVKVTGTNSIVGSGSSANLIVTDNETAFAFVEVIDQTTDERNFVEMFIEKDGTQTNVSQYFLDNAPNNFSTNFIGTFTSYLDSGSIKLNFENTETNSVLVRAKVVSFDDTSVGIGTHRFKAFNQPDGSENSARLQSNFSSGTGVRDIVTLDALDVTSIKSVVQVETGNSTAVHQVLTINDGIEATTTQMPFLSIGSTSGIGTFGSEFSGSDITMKFYPDASVSGIVTVKAFNELLQTDTDLVNVPNPLEVGTLTQTFLTGAYNAINGPRANRTNFIAQHDGVPIFRKTFNPGISTVLDLANDTFNIDDHFFNTGERLVYNPGSSFAGVAGTAIQTSGGIDLPTEVYAIRVNKDQFKLASSKANANSGTALTIIDNGGGNAHTIDMFKKLEKTVISIDGIVQHPVAYSKLDYQLTDNGGSIGVGQTFISLTGISSIGSGDLLKINDEFVNIVSVGLGTTALGPITGSGAFNLVLVKRGSLGSVETTHNDGDAAEVHVGSFNIVGSEINFKEAPRGNITRAVDDSNLPFPKSTFGGRAYLRSDYDTNIIFDDASKSFTGIGATYTLTVGGANTTGIETGSGILFVNNIFQTPTTDNNDGGNYIFEEGTAGISSVIFSGVKDVNGNLILSDYDVNVNQLPRGGVPVSFGSTNGLGIAPLVGASVTAFVTGGVIQSVGISTLDIIGSGYRGVVSVAVTDTNGHGADVTATVGAGGTLSFTVNSGGTGYTNPIISVPEPSYENLEFVGVSRPGLGATTEVGENLLVNLIVGPTSVTGIGSTLFEVKDFKITRPGYGFREGDVIKPVGMVTDRGIAAMTDFELTITEVFNDSFAAWQFGELDYIDSIKVYQNGTRTRFPLFYRGELRSFELDENNTDSLEIDLNAILLVFVNGVIQEPGKHYNFTGGTSMVFTEPPDPDEDVDIFFYRGTRGTDSFSVNIVETVKRGDTLKLYKNINNPNTVEQEPRVIYDLSSSDKIETNLYAGLGIDEINFKPISWTKQKVDRNISGDLVYKNRDSIEPMVFPTSRIIGDVSLTDTEIFVDNAQFFDYEQSTPIEVDGVIVANNIDPVAAALTATVGPNGTITDITVVDGGSGYLTPNAVVRLSAPKAIGVGIGTTAEATVAVVNGSLVVGGATIANAGFGYTHSAPPQVIADTTAVRYENVLNADTVEGWVGIVTGVRSTAGTGGHPLALEFHVNSSTWAGLNAGYPVFINGTRSGHGVVSVDGNDTSTVGVGTTFADNIYIVHQVSNVANNGILTCNVLSTTNLSNFNVSGTTSQPCGRVSWGRISGFSRSSTPVSIGVTGLTVDSGLSTFPTIQRRGTGFKQTGGAGL